MDKYSSFLNLSKNERCGQDFRVRLHKRDSAILIIAPHGGEIEPGTSEIAEAIAGDDYSFYAFEGIKASRNRDLHLTSSRFDEPRGIGLAAVSKSAIAIHGEKSIKKVVFVGGLDKETLERIRDSLPCRGFCVMKHENRNLQGTNNTNICNRTLSGKGVQLEISKGLRESFFDTLSKKGRQTGNDRFVEFIGAVRAGLA